MSGINDQSQSTRAPIWPTVMCLAVMLLCGAGMWARLAWGGPVGSLTTGGLGIGGLVIAGLGTVVWLRPTRNWVIVNRMKLAVLTGSVCVSLVLAETVLRVIDPVLEPPWEIDAALGWVPKRNLRTHMRDPDTGALRLVTTDENGFRSEPLRPDSRKIAVVGDSMTFGLMASQDAIVTTRLSKRLGPEFQVINASAGGWGTDQELIFFRDRVLPQKPETVIWVFSDTNDVINNMIDHMFFWPETPKPRYSFTDGALRLHAIGPERLLRPDEDSFYSIRLVGLVRKASVRLRTEAMVAHVSERTMYPEDFENDYSHYCIYANDPSPRLRRGFALTGALLREAKRIARQGGVKIHFVAFDPAGPRGRVPDLAATSKYYGWDPNLVSLEAGRRNLRTIAAGAGIDLHLYNLPPGGRFKTDGHLSAKGHVDFAEYLHRLLTGKIPPTFAEGDDGRHHAVSLSD